MTKYNSPPLDDNGEVQINETSGSNSEQSVFLQLLEVSHALKHALEPIEARQSFVDQLHNELRSNVENARQTFRNRRARQRHMKWTIIGASSIVYIVSMAIMLSRLSRWVLQRLRNTASQDTD